MLQVNQLSGFYQGLGAPPLVFTPAFSIGLGSSSGSSTSSTYTYVQKILPAGLGGIAGTTIKLKARSATTGNATMDGCYIGLSAITGNAYNFASTPTQVTWNAGQTSLAMASGAEYFSDEIAFNMTGTAAITISFQFATNFRIAFNSSAGGNHKSYAKPSTSQAGTVLKASGYTATSGMLVSISQLLVA